MPQISLYIDGPTLKKVEAAANREHVSISRWVGMQLKERVDPVYPAGFENLFGSIADASFQEPEEPHFDSDTHREAL